MMGSGQKYAARATTIGRSGGLTAASSTSCTVTNVTVNNLPASVFADNTFAKDGFTLIDGTNAFNARAQDALGRSDAQTNSCFLPASISFLYDLNGNLLSDGRRGFDYDDENQLIRVTVTNTWKTEFVYDGKSRRRIRKEFVCSGSAWLQTQEIRYIYDGSAVIQERDSNNVPVVNYTRGIDLGGGRQSAGGIGGLLARTAPPSTINPQLATSYHHCDRVGNITTLINQSRHVVAKYLYDPYGNIIAKSGPLAEANLYRFSSKECHPNSGLVFFGSRFYDPNLQRWINRDPTGEAGGVNLHRYCGNSPMLAVDPWGNDEFLTVHPLQPDGQSLFPHYDSLFRSFTDALDTYVSWVNPDSYDTGDRTGEQGTGGGSSGAEQNTVGGQQQGQNGPITGNSPVGNFLRGIPLIGGMLGAVGDIVSGLVNTALGALTLGESGTLGTGLSQLGGGLVGEADILARDVEAGLIGAGGKVYTAIRDTANLLTLGQTTVFSTPENGHLVGNSGLWGAIKGFLEDAPVPCYGAFNGSGWGVPNWGTDQSLIVNRGDNGGYWHDQTYYNGWWLRDWLSTRGPYQAVGPIGVAFFGLGAPYFSISTLFQTRPARDPEFPNH